MDDYRADFELSVNRSMSMPFAGLMVWSSVAVLSTQLDSDIAILVLLFMTGAIFPLALLIAKVREENLISSKNPLAKLMGMCVLMVNLLWVVHIPLYLYQPEFVPLSLGVSLGLHWVVYSWIVQHPVGLVHAGLRALACFIAWFLWPEARLFAISTVIVVMYLFSLFQLATRPVSSLFTEST